MKTQYYLLVIWGDVSSEVKGPYRNEEERNFAALKYKEDDPNEENGLYMLDVDERGVPSVYDYSGGYMMVAATDCEVVNDLWWAGASMAQKAFALSKHCALSDREAWEQAEAENLSDLPEPLRECFEVEA